MQKKKKEINYIDLYKKYTDVWLVLDADTKEVMGVGKTLQTASNRAEKLGVKRQHFVRIPKEKYKYAPHF